MYAEEWAAFKAINPRALQFSSQTSRSQSRRKNLNDQFEMFEKQKLKDVQSLAIERPMTQNHAH